MLFIVSHEIPSKLELDNTSRENQISLGKLPILSIESKKKIVWV